MLRLTRTLASLGILVFVLEVSAGGQFWDRITNPKVRTQIQHPPALGIQINKIAFGAESGAGATEFVEALSERFVRAGVEVIERSRLESLLKEQNFNLSGYVDAKRAAEMGKILGPSVMIFANFQRYTTEKKPLVSDFRDYQGIVRRTFISRTQAFVRGSVRSVDLATSRVFAQKVLEASPIVENKLVGQCCPEFPQEFEVLDGALSSVVGQAARLYLPWTETVDLYYFDDKDCNLKGAYNLHKAGSTEAALQQSLANLETCRALPKQNPKLLAHALHNVGMGYFSLNDHSKALQFLNEAQSLKPESIYREAIVACQRADQLSREMQQVETSAEFAAANAERKAQADEATLIAESMTNKDVLALLGAKIPASIIVAKIQSASCKFDTGTNALIELSKAGAGADIITAMMQCGKK